jgi:site-specific recombinase XerD
MVQERKEITTQKPTRATILKRLMMSKGTERTRKAYSSDLRDFAQFLGIESAGDDHPLASVPDQAWLNLDTAVIAGYLEHLKGKISLKTGRRFSTATVARRTTAVREFLTEARYLGYFPRDRLEYIKERLTTPEISHLHHGGISPDDQNKLLEMADSQPGLKGKRDYALFRLWLDTGIRRAELAALKVRDLVVKEGIPTLAIRHGKGNKIREIGLEAYTTHVVRVWLEDSQQGADPENPIFCQVRKVRRGEIGQYRVISPRKHLSGEALRGLVRCIARRQTSRAR